MSLGLVANGKRSIRSGREYDRYFDIDQVKGEEIELMPDGTVHDTLRHMQKIVRSTLPQTKRIASKLKGPTRQATCRNLFNFLYRHVQYKKDNPIREQLRTPLRTWKDRATGVDCDCYSIFISSVLTNLGIPHAFRMAGYQGDFQHVYVIVPKSGDDYSSYFTIDPVVDRFDYETPFNKKYDHGMNKVTMLNGVGECNTKPVFDRLRRYVHTDELVDRGLVPTRQFLEQNGFTFEKIIDPRTDGGAFAVATRGGIVQVPTVLTKQQAQQLLDGKQSGCACQHDKPSEEEQPGENKKFWWGWIAIGAGALLLLTGSDQQEVKPGLSGLAGTSKKKQKVRTIHI